MSTFHDFFQAATGNAPYHWQERLATGSENELHTSTDGSLCQSQLINIPTGLGKTAGVVLAWLWNRIFLQSEEWPRRLVYCLPMRTLVEQTAGEIEKWINKLLEGENGRKLSLDDKVKADLLWLRDHSPVILMGGEDLESSKRDWDIYPEKPAILIGTQDMLLSRALNRGYGMSRYRWPMHFGLLNNDALWVMDETQLMGVGVETSSQLDGFRHHEKSPTFSSCKTWWMSATLEDLRLATVDHPTPANGWPNATLSHKDREAVKHRLQATKRLQRAELVLSKQLKDDQYAKELAKFVLKKHVAGELTLVIVNRVSRAQELYKALRKEGRTQGLALVHSRFRPTDRQKHQELLLSEVGDRLIVATQAVEAGVDVSARVLVTELAPWASLVQRFGRCNRGGEFNAEGAEIHWIDLDFEKDDDVAPYTLVELLSARKELEKLQDKSVNPDELGSIHVAPPFIIRPVIRRKDLTDFFDTTPDIAGQDLDISRYIRDGEDTDVQVFWRDLSASDFLPTEKIKEPARDELCRVAVWRFKAFLEKLEKQKDGRGAYVWDGLRDEWRKETRARTGAVYLVDRRAGGYEIELGWTGELAGLKKEAEWVPTLQEGMESSDAIAKDPLTFVGKSLSLSTHTQHVVGELSHLLDNIRIASDWRDSLLIAAHWHDIGKSHEAFQEMLRKAAGDGSPEELLAKSGKRGGSFSEKWRKYFRHELASALAWLANHDEEKDADLIAYIIAAHHGKVRLSIRSMPEEEPPPEHAHALMARGILDGDKLPTLSLNSLSMPETTLHLDLMRMGCDADGHPSWLARTIALRDNLGPFTLAYLETLLRAADMRASADETQTAVLQ